MVLVNTYLLLSAYCQVSSDSVQSKQVGVYCNTKRKSSRWLKFFFRSLIIFFIWAQLVVFYFLQLIIINGIFSFGINYIFGFSSINNWQTVKSRVAVGVTIATKFQNKTTLMARTRTYLPDECCPWHLTLLNPYIGFRKSLYWAEV